MRKAFLLVGCMLAFALAAETVKAHGGTYTGPGGGGSPGFSGPRGGGTFGPGPGNPNPGGGGGTTGNPSGGGSSPGPGGGGAPARPGGGAAGGAPRGLGGTTPGASKKSKYTPKHMNWDWWWDLNEERFLNLKSKVRSQAAASDNTDSFLGGVSGGDEVAAVTVKQIRNNILPTLKLALKDEYYDARAGAVIALGKVGDSSQPELVDDIKALMADSDKRVRESCCLALGILGNKDAVADLMEVIKNTQKGRKMVGRSSDILNRTRAFASVAIGLIGSREGFNGGDDVVQNLVKLATTKSKQQDVQVGPSLALQLIQSQEAVPAMIEIFNDPEQNRYVRAHMGVALGKVGAKSAVSTLVKNLENKESYVAYSSAISLGLLTEKEDRKTVNKLLRIAKNAPNLGTKNFATIALGEIGNAKGRAYLLERLVKGKSHDQAFAAISLGIMGYKHREEVNLMGRALLKEFGRTKSDDQRSAMAIGLGLLEYEPAREILRKELSRPGSQNLKGNLCTALGLMNDKDSIPEIRNLVKQKGDPDLRKRASIALGLLQDTEAVEILKKVIQESSASKAILGAATVALGYVGDRNAVPVLQKFVENADRGTQDVTRAFATVALGFLGDKDEIPLLSRIHENSNYLAQTEALAELLSIL